MSWKCVHIDQCLYFYRIRDSYQNTTFQRNKSIQDHLALGRTHYLAEFTVFNERRLAEEKKASSKDLSYQNLTTADLSVVVPVAVPSALTTRCLESIRKWAPGAEVILVANGCEPTSETALLAQKIVRLEINIGFAAGVNRGAMEATRKLIMVVNDDCCFVDDTPLRLVKALDGRTPIVGPYSNRAKPPQGDIAKEAVPQADSFPEMVTGVCMVLPTGLFRKLGGFDPRLDTWEDDDLCARARDFGYRCKVVGGAYVEHERHATFKALGKDVQAVMDANAKIFGKKQPRIKVVAIAKDEERSIAGFFKQFLPVTREFFLLDTGSTDGTVAAAKEMGATVESARFVDFSQARNEALQRFGQDADWIVMLDPDERLDFHTIENLKETLFRTPFDILLAPLQAVHPEGTTRAFVPKPFVFRSHPEIRWIFKVHEKLIGSHKQALVSNAMIDHVIALHDGRRRLGSEILYGDLAKTEPYFMDPAFKEAMRKEWPILDYDRMDDQRIAKIHAGPLVSVIVPTYKRPDLVRHAVASILTQDYANLEAIVVGDACPDLDPSWWGDPRIRVFNLPKNHGAGGAEPRNYGIMLAAGELIAYVDDDNWILPDHVSSLYAALREFGAEYAFSSMSVDGKDLKFSEPKKGGIDTSCVLHKKNLILKHGWWKDREAVGYDHDFEFFSRWMAANEKWACTGRPTLVYNADTSGQAEFIRSLAEAASGKT